MNDKKYKFQVEFASVIGMLASRFSISPTVGQIYGLLYMSPRPISLNEMVERLRISKGSASTNVRILESWGAVRKVWVDNTRKDYYEANPDILKIIINRLREGLDKRMSETKSHFADSEKKYIEDRINMDSQDQEFFNERIKKIKEMQEQVMGFIEFLSNKE